MLFEKHVTLFLGNAALRNCEWRVKQCSRKWLTLGASAGGVWLPLSPLSFSLLFPFSVWFAGMVWLVGSDPDSCIWTPLTWEAEKESTLKRRDKEKHHNGTQTTDKLKTTFWMCLKGLLLHGAIRGPLFRRKIKYRVWKLNIEQRFTTRKKREGFFLFFLLPV